ncbi:hypothetical protein HMI55_005095 [Coelomomyces lativittatus]|nr:hypothetical protein HMI55_005095 [Coelomomyces lativittatus]
MSSLAKQSQDFLRKLAHQPVFGKPVIPPVNPSSSTSRPFYKHGFKPPGKKLPTLSVAIQAALITILDYLKKSGKQSRDTYDILAETQIELKAVPGLEAYLQDHPKIAYDPEFNTYTYIPEFVIGSKEELLEWIATRNKYPIETNLLSDSFSGVNEALLELEKEQKIYLLRNKSGNPHLIFYNRWYDPTDYEMNTLFKTEFFKLKVPDEIDLAKQLSQAHRMCVTRSFN